MKNKIYIAGKISGIPYIQAYTNFLIAEEILSPIGITINPTRLCPSNWSWRRAMVKCIWVLITQCDRIYLQDNWTDSRGAKIEVFFAIIFNKKIINISNL